MTLALLQELLWALRANDAEGFKGWLAVAIEELGRAVVAEVDTEWLVVLLFKKELVNRSLKSYLLNCKYRYKQLLIRVVDITLTKIRNQSS